MKPFDLFSRFLLRFRYPLSLPEDIATSLGIDVSNEIAFDDFVNYLICPNCCPTRLMKFMPREMAENAFERAPCKEKFRDRTLISFQFNEGWMEFDLQFDSESRLRRIYVQHKNINQERGVEIKLR
jgi:hypothetical protein